jgi:hypothetical protein
MTKDLPYPKDLPENMKPLYDEVSVSFKADQGYVNETGTEKFNNLTDAIKYNKGIENYVRGFFTPVTAKGNIRNNAKATKYAKQILKKKPVQAKSNNLNIVDTNFFYDQINSIRKSINNYSDQKQLENKITNTRPKPRTSTGLNYLAGVYDED